jgi:hypothetical protein
MADVTTTVVDSTVMGDRQVRFVTATFTAGYAIAGETLSAASCNLAEIKFIAVAGAPSVDDASTAVGVIVTQATNTLRCVLQAGGAYVGTDDLSSTTVDLVVYGV